MIKKIITTGKYVAASILIILFTILLLGYLYTYYKEHVRSLTTPSSVQQITTAEGTISYLSYGTSTDQPIVLLHGTGANAFIWETTSVFLASHGYYVIAVDLPPFGWSQIPPNPQDYKKETQAKKVIASLEALSIKKPIILGHSYTSKVALLVATQYPSRELILVAPVFEYGEKTDSGILGTLTSVSIIRDPLLSLFVNNTLLAKKVLLSFMYKKDVDVSATLSKTILPFNKPDVNHAYGEWFQEFFDESSAVLDSGTLSHLQIPVRVLWGDMDTIAPIKNFEKLHALQSRATITTIKGIGHMPHLEDSSLFNTLLLEELSK